MAKVVSGSSKQTLEMWEPSRCIAYARNARVIPDSAIGKVAASIKEFGFKAPIIVDRDGVVIAGHTRLLAAERLKLKTVPVLVAADLSDAQVKAYRLADNRTAQESTWEYELLNLELEELAGLDIDLTLTGFDPDELAGLPLRFGSGSDVVEDEAPEPPDDPITKPGDLWLLGEHRVLCGSSTDAANYVLLMAGNQAECMWTDPPYGVAYQDPSKMKTGDKYASARRKDGLTVSNDDLTPDGLGDLLREAVGGALANMGEGCAAYVAAPAGPLQVVFATTLDGLGVYRQVLVWVKDQFVFGRQDYQWRHEFIFYGWKPGAAHKWYGGRTLDTVIEIPRPKRSEEHPTMKPVELVARCVHNSTRKGDLVLDPFLGSGTTLIAAEQTGRICYGMEIDPRYCDVIVKRWENLTGKKATRAS